MKLIALAAATIQGLTIVGILALLEVVVQAFRPEWSLPFSVWWGLLFCLPGIALAAYAAKHRL